MGYRLIPISKVLGLSLNEMYTYFCILAKSDYELHTSHIKLDTLSELTGIRKTEYLSKHIAKLEDKGLLLKKQIKHKGDKGVFNLNTYKLYHPTKDWVRVDLKLLDMDIDSKLKAFLILLKCLCVNNTNYTGYNKSQIKGLLKMSPGTITKYFKEGERLGFIKEQDNGFFITNTDIFYIDLIKDEKDEYYTHIYCGVLQYLKSKGVNAPLYNKEKAQELSRHFGNTSLIVENLKKHRIPKGTPCSWEYIFKVLHIPSCVQIKKEKAESSLIV